MQKAVARALLLPRRPAPFPPLPLDGLPAPTLEAITSQVPMWTHRTAPRCLGLGSSMTPKFLCCILSLHSEYPHIFSNN
jgi:hypothetical protein